MGKGQLQAHGDAAFALVARAIETGEPKERQRAAELAALLLSPWQRAMAAGDKHHGQIALFRPRRPTARPVGHPKAPLIRRAALAALRATLDRTPRKAPEGHAEAPAAPGWEQMQLARALCDCLAEVADPAAADAVASLLEKEPSRRYAVWLIACLETVHGLPASYRMGGLCGLSTPEERRQFARSEDARCNAARAKLLDWRRRCAALPLAERTEAALDAWDAELQAGRCMYYSESGDWATEEQLTPMIRLGVPAVAPIRRRQAKAPDLIRRGVYEIVVAAITGTEDPALIRALLAHKRNQPAPKHPLLACEIIAAAGSRAWTQQLVALQNQPSYHQRRASHTLAVVYRKDALPILRRADPRLNNYIAPCAVKELDSWAE